MSVTAGTSVRADRDRAQAVVVTRIDPLVFFVMILLAAAVMLFSAPTVAGAANAYGQTFAGQQVCLSCHGASSGRWQVGTYVNTAHGQFVTPIVGNPSAIVPDATKWPSPTYGGGLSFGVSDIGWMLGAPGVIHEYVTKYKNTGSHQLETSQTMNAVTGPADDLMSTGSLEWDTPEGVWGSAKVAPKAYFQGCGGCHFLGVTRPTDKGYTLGSGAAVTHSTETSYSGVGIQCEACHGTGQAGITHWTAGVDIVRTKQALESQVCGQCHVTGTAKEKNYAGGTFSNPNGYTPDRRLSDFFSVTGTQYIKTSPNMEQPSIPTTESKFYPNGANKSMHHSYYNEWSLTAHARSLRYSDGTLWSTHGNDECLRCHSGEGFLKSIGYGEQGPNDIGLGESSIESDTLDIECAVCHTVHSTTGDALGLRMNGEELCGACHNSEIAEGETFTPGAAVHHPQREMHEGYGLIGVPASADRFMGDTECPQCHMPKTRETRVSHSFKPMSPGDAETWGVPEGGDSCTPCHTSLSRDTLQDDMDEWAADLDDLATQASDAIAAAKSRAASSTTAGTILIGSAKTNADFVAADASKGAHNYPYAKAGLQKAVFFARTVGASFTRFGATAYDPTKKMAMLYGTLAMGDGGPAAAEAVTILAKPNGVSAWTALGTARTGDDGHFGFAVDPSGTTSYKILWSPKSDVSVYSAVATVTRTSSTTAYVSTTSLRLGRTVSVSGAVAPKHGGKAVTVWYRKGSGSWSKLVVRTLGSNSTYSCSWKPGRRATYYVKTQFAGDASHTGSVSVTRKVTVR